MALAAELGVADRVTLLGLVEGSQKETELVDADIFVYPTEHDAQPLVVLEAMAAGLPIVAAGVGGIPETLADCGVVVDPGDPEALAGALRDLIDRPALRDELGRCARARYCREYTPGAFATRVREVFGELPGSN
jgi:glycosyltransferase involved in cell wall biosynthesis